MKKYLYLGFIFIVLLFCLNSCSNSVTPATGYSGNHEVNILNGPRIGLVTVSQATISWDTDKACIGEIKWGTSADNYENSKKEDAETTHHRITIENLNNSSTYHYKIYSGDSIGEDSTVSTAPIGNTPFTFISMADNRGSSVASDLVSSTPAFKNIVNTCVKLDYDFIVHVGDLFYVAADHKTHYDTLKKLYGVFKNTITPLASKAPFLISPGNHEMRVELTDHGTAFEMFNEEFAQPDQLSGYKGTCYSWDWGNSHFVSIDSCRYNTSESNQGMGHLSNSELTWLENDLISAQSRHVRHIFVFSHCEAYAKPSWTLYYLGSVSEAVRDQFWNMLVQYKVDAYICGHIHDFNDQLGQNGVVQWLNGNSGAVNEAATPTPGDPYADSNDFTLWQVDGDTVTAQLINEFGQVLYTRTFTSSQP